MKAINFLVGHSLYHNRVVLFGSCKKIISIVKVYQFGFIYPFAVLLGLHSRFGGGAKEDALKT